jgi:hypothetical protein
VAVLQHHHACSFTFFDYIKHVLVYYNVCLYLKLSLFALLSFSTRVQYACSFAPWSGILETWHETKHQVSSQKTLPQCWYFYFSNLAACIHSSYNLKVIRGSGSSRKYNFTTPVIVHQTKQNILNTFNILWMFTV